MKTELEFLCHEEPEDCSLIVEGKMGFEHLLLTTFGRDGEECPMNVSVVLSIADEERLLAELQRRKEERDGRR